MRYYNVFLRAALLFGAAVIILAQFSIPTLFDADSYLHIRMAEFIKQYGLRYDFHWARYSVFAGHFADKDFLYHLLTVPFTYLPNIFFGAKIAACVNALFLYAVFFFLLSRYCLKKLSPFFLIAILFSATFVGVISSARPMIFVIALCLLYVHFLIKKKQWPLLIVTFIYTLSHVSSPLLLVFAFLAEITRFINERQFVWKSIGATLLGLLAGFLIHPNFPNNLLVFYLNGIWVPFFALKWGLELGAEFFPTDTRELVLGYPFILIGLVLLAAQATSQGNKIKVSTKIWMAVSGFFFVFSFFSRRYIIHSYPLLLISFAAYCSDWWQSQARYIEFRRSRKAVAGLAVCVSAVFILIGFGAYQRFRAISINEMVRNKHYETIAGWMQKNIPPGEIIFHANWSDSQYFIGLNPQNDYFVTFDPIYMYYWNPPKYGLYRDIAFGRTQQPYVLLKEVFGIKYGYVSKDYFGGLIAQIMSDTRFDILAEDNFGLVFRLKP